MKATLGALLLTSMFVLSALPAQAAAAQPTAMTVVLKSTGEILYLPYGSLDGFNSCSGTAPTSNSCELKDHSNYPGSGGWLVGWNAVPPNPATLMSTEVVMTGSTGSERIDFECDWAGVGTFFPFLGIRCGIISLTGFPGGNLDAKFHTGAYDPRAAIPFLGPSLPSLNGVEAGVGDWQAILYAY